MKRIVPLIAVAVLSLTAPLQAKPTASATKLEPANEKLHRQLCQINSGWLERRPDFGTTTIGQSTDPEIALIQTHLSFVVAELKQANTAHLTETQREQRLRHIETLIAYTEDGRFPQNVFVSGYRPVFIDPWGTHCAVGHLIATSGAGALAETINAEHQLDYLCDIKTAGLSEWQKNSGFTVDELALIQPSYHSQTLSYPEEIEDLLLGDSTAIRAALEADPTLVTARCGGKTLLHFAAAAGDLDFVKLLIEKGADLHVVSESNTPINPGAEAETSNDSAPQLPVHHMRPSSSSTLYTVRWNEPTLKTPNHPGGVRMGMTGRIFSTKRGVQIANELGDLYGGVAHKNAIHFASTRARMYFNGSKMVLREETEPELIQLNEGRAEVIAFLKAQGLDSVGS